MKAGEKQETGATYEAPLGGPPNSHARGRGARAPKFGFIQPTCSSAYSFTSLGFGIEFLSVVQLVLSSHLQFLVA